MSWEVKEESEPPYDLAENYAMKSDSSLSLSFLSTTPGNKTIEKRLTPSSVRDFHSGKPFQVM